jgi:hypothetical protein
MSKQEQRAAAVISQAIQAAGVSGVHVEVDDQEVAYLDGEVANLDDEVAAVQAAIAVGAVEVVDGLHYPDMPVVTHHVKAITQGVPVDHHKDKQGH